MPNILRHLHKNKQGIRSTVAQAANIQLTPEPPVEEICTKIIPLPHLTCTDTGKFPACSKSGNNYAMIMHNTILMPCSESLSKTNSVLHCKKHF